MRQRTVTEMDQKILGHLHRAGSAVLMADLAEEAAADLEGQLRLSSVSTASGDASSSELTSYWCELRGTDISYFATRGGDIAGTIHVDKFSIVDGVLPVAAQAIKVGSRGGCFTLVNGQQNRLFVVSAPDDEIKTAWVTAIHAAKEDTGDVATDVPETMDAKTMGDELLAALQQREEEEAAKRRLRRKTFLMEDSFLSGIG